MAINGTGNADTLWGTLGDDVIDALGGNDIIHGSQGTDTVNGGLGIDRLIFTLADASLFTAAMAARSYTIGLNTVTDSSALLNTSFTGIENITFSTVGAGDYDDTINASGFNGTGLTIALGNGHANVFGSATADIINTGRGNNIVSAGLANDNIIASHGADTLNGEGGTDRVTLNMFNTNLFDAATGSRTYTLTTTNLSDSSGTLNSTMSGIERITIDTRFTGNFADTIDASGFVTATPANPLTVVLNVTTGDGNDTVTGTAYRDFIQTGLGDDTVDAGDGDDSIFVGLGTNIVDGGAGIDDVSFIFANDTSYTLFITQIGTTFTTTLNGVVTNTISNAEYLGFRNADINAAITRVDASGVAFGALLQLGFDDHNGSDILIGSHGIDFFSNGTNYTAGNDIYTGNGGADIFDYTFAVNGMDGDTITDFDADDVIDLRSNNATQNGGVGLLANQFIGNAAFSNVAGQYRYEYSGGQTRLQVDTNGDGVADETLTIANGEFGLVETLAGSNLLMRANLVNGDNNSNLNLRGTLGADVVNGFDQADRIYASQGNDVINGGGFNDRLTLNMYDATLFAAATGARSYTVTTNRVTDSSGTLNTTMTSIERITFDSRGAGDFNDTVNVSGFVSGAPSGIVTLFLGNGNNTVIGSNYGDFISVGTGYNVIDGGAGHDDVQFVYDNTTGNTLYLTGSVGTVVATLDGVILNNFTNIEGVTAWGSDGNAAMTVINASGLTIAGQVGFFDTNGTNIGIGHNGVDFFSNGYLNTIGNDTYTGNGGADIFDYTFAVGGMDGDHITDLDGDDVIDLQFNNATQNGGGLLANQFIGSAAFTNVAGQYRYYASGGQTYVQADTNGDGIADETLTIANGQFVLAETLPGSNLLKIGGLVADGYVVGATLFVDANGNQTLDIGEASTITGAGGTFTLNQAGTLVAIGGANADTGLANDMTLVAPSGSGVVNPLTTLIQAVIEQGNSLAAAEAKVLAALGLDPDLDLLNLDLIAAAATDPNALDAQKAAAMIANLVSSAEGVEDAPAGAEKTLVEALAALVAETDAGDTIDLTDTATLTPLLTEALPGLDVSAVVTEVAFEGDAIADAESINEISDAQLDAHLFNHIAGGNGNDRLEGGTGSDRFVGGNGFDNFIGGGGNDVFVAEITAAKIPTKLGSMSIDVVRDFNQGDKIDLSGIDANAGRAGHQAFTWKGTNANKAAGDLSYKTYTSVQGAEKALGIDLDGTSPYSGPVTIVYGNDNGSTPDFAIALFGISSLNPGDFIFV